MTTGVALRATLWLRARMTEQADIPATENKSPPPAPSPHTPGSSCPVAGVPESWSYSCLVRASG